MPGSAPIVPLPGADRRGGSAIIRSGRFGGVWSIPRASASNKVAQRCLQGSPCGLKYGQEHEVSSLVPRSRARTRYLVVPRTLATISLGLADIKLTRPFEKYDWPRARTASLKFRATFWAIPIIYSQFGRTLESDVGGPLLSTLTSAYLSQITASNIEVLDLKGMFLDELPAWFDIVAHEGGEQVVGGGGVIEPYLHEGAASRVHRGFPELFSVHFAQSLEAGDLHPLLANLAHGRHQSTQVEQGVAFAVAVECEPGRGVIAGHFAGKQDVGSQAEFVAETSQVLVERSDLVQLDTANLAVAGR